MGSDDLWQGSGFPARQAGGDPRRAHIKNNWRESKYARPIPESRATENQL